MKLSSVIKTFILFTILASCLDAKRLSGSRGSSRGSSNRGTKTKAKPAPTSFSYPQPAQAPKPSLFNWQQKPAQKTSWQSTNTKTSQNQHSYPSSNTGLSGNTQAKQPTKNQESVQSSNVPASYGQQNVHAANSPNKNNQPAHTYPSSGGLSGGSSANSPNKNNQPAQSYPSSNGMSGGSQAAGGGYPQGSMSGSNAGQQNPAGHYPSSNVGNTYHHPQGPPPPYSPQGYGNPGSFGGAPGYGGHGGVGGYGGYGGQGGYGHPQQMPGYFGNYGNYGKGYNGVSRSSSALKGIGIAGAGIGTVLTGLALWNLARSTGHNHHTVVYDNRGQPVAVVPENNTDTTAAESFLKDLVNCSLTISSENSTEVIAIPCAIATSFSPEADVKDGISSNDIKDKTKCIVTVVTKTEKEYMTTVPCSILLTKAAENNVTEPPIQPSDAESIPIGEGVASNSTDVIAEQRTSNTDEIITTPKISSESLTNDCVSKSGETKDPLEPCNSVTDNLTVIPLSTTIKPDSN